MQNLISAILAFLAALTVAVSPAPQDTQSQVVVQSTPTVSALPNCYESDDPNCWNEFYLMYQNCPQQLVDAAGNVHVNDGHDLEFPELCKIWEYAHNPTPMPLPTTTPTPMLAPTEPRLPRGPTNTPAP